MMEALLKKTHRYTYMNTQTRVKSSLKPCYYSEDLETKADQPAKDALIL